jgi:hypothetical protein
MNIYVLMWQIIKPQILHDFFIFKTSIFTLTTIIFLALYGSSPVQCIKYNGYNLTFLPQLVIEIGCFFFVFKQLKRNFIFFWAFVR